jgi:hypothetical protein
MRAVRQQPSPAYTVLVIREGFRVLPSGGGQSKVLRRMLDEATSNPGMQ